jgi:hypothetical protein
LDERHEWLQKFQHAVNAAGLCNGRHDYSSMKTIMRAIQGMKSEAGSTGFRRCIRGYSGQNRVIGPVRSDDLLRTSTGAASYGEFNP